MIQKLLYFVAFIVIIFGIYKIFVDDEKGVGYAAFVFSIITFLISMNLGEFVSVMNKSESKTEVSEEENEEENEEKNEDETSEPDQEYSSSTSSIDDEYDNISNNNDDGENSSTTKISGNSFSGNIIAEEQEDVYEYIPDISGIYRFDFDSNDANSDYEFSIYSSNGKVLADTYYSNKGETIELTAGEKYSITVKQNSGKSKYKITIGIPNKIETVNGTTIARTVTYSDQKDEYLYTAPITGQYRFDFSISNVECDYIFKLYASNNEELASEYYSSKGKTVNLTAGETYSIVIEQYSGYFDYSISIGVPNAEQSIESNSFSGSITYIEQLDRYTFIPPLDGTYRFDFITDNAQCDYIFNMYASNNEELASTYYSNDGTTVDLLAGETYRIEIKQYSGFENYTINVGIPNNITNIDGNIISGTLSYIDQENIYMYKAPVSGEYLFDFGTNDTEADYKFYIDSPIHENITSTYCSNNSITVQLEEGQEYTITVKQSSGFPTYEISISTQ